MSEMGQSRARLAAEEDGKRALVIFPLTAMTHERLTRINLTTSVASDP